MHNTAQSSDQRPSGAVTSVTAGGNWEGQEQKAKAQATQKYDVVRRQHADFEHIELLGLTIDFSQLSAQYTARNREGRSYADFATLKQARGDVTLLCDDLRPSTAISGLPLTAISFGAAFAVYPLLVTSLREALSLDMTAKIVASTLGGGFSSAVSLLYSVVLGLVFPAMVTRQETLQNLAAEEVAMLGKLAWRTVALLDSCPTCGGVTGPGLKALAAIWEHTTTLSKRSRAAELELVARDDTYRRYQRALLEWQSSVGGEASGARVYDCLNLTDDLVQVRAKRMSVEVLGNPPALLAVQAVLALDLVASFAAAAAESPGAEANVLVRCAFALLTATFVVAEFVALDLTDPFQGYLHIRRSSLTAELVRVRRELAAASGANVARGWEEADL